jgi:hypothetical protein
MGLEVPGPSADPRARGCRAVTRRAARGSRTPSPQPAATISSCPGRLGSWSLGVVGRSAQCGTAGVCAWYAGPILAALARSADLLRGNPGRGCLARAQPSPSSALGPSGHGCAARPWARPLPPSPAHQLYPAERAPLLTPLRVSNVPWHTPGRPVPRPVCVGGRGAGGTPGGGVQGLALVRASSALLGLDALCPHDRRYFGASFRSRAGVGATGRARASTSRTSHARATRVTRRISHARSLAPLMRSWNGR